MKAKFKENDIVYLISGSPAMTITRVKEVSDDIGEVITYKYTCEWFHHKKSDRKVFKENALTPTNPNE